MHQKMAATLDTIVAEIKTIQSNARANDKNNLQRPMWPMIILRSPKGWTGPKEVDGKKSEDYWRSHQVPFSDMVDNPKHLTLLETWLSSYRPKELFDDSGYLNKELRELAPPRSRRMGSNPHANGGQLLKDLKLPDFRDYAVEVSKPGQSPYRR